MNTRWQRACLCIALLLVLSVSGCSSSSEGGIVGSGISSVQGNIVQVEDPSDLNARTDRFDGGSGSGALPTIRVSIDEGAGSETITDAAGAFVLQGTFAGTVTVRFQRVSDEETLGTLTIEIGAGATVVLPDVEIRTDLPDEARVQVRPPLQINLFGEVTSRDCAGGALQIEDESAAHNQFVLRVNDATEFVNADDTASVRCLDVEVGDRVTVVEGIVDRDAGVIETVKLRVQPDDPSPPAIVRVRRRGIVLRTACARGLIHFQDAVPDDLVTAHLHAGTAVTCGSDTHACTCNDIAFGDMIDVVGMRRADNARNLEATRVHVTPNPASSFVTTASGDVTSVDCIGRELRALVTQVSGDTVRPQEMVVRLSDATTYRCFGDLACSCADVRPRDRIALELLVPVDQSNAPEALVVGVVSAARLRFSGVTTSVECGSGRLHVTPDNAPLLSVEVAINRATEIVLPDGSPTTCRALIAGTRIGISGHVERGVPGAVRRNVADLIRLERVRR